MAMEKILIVNIGSASKKYALFDGDKEAAKFHFEFENGGFLTAIKFGGNEERKNISKKEYDLALNYILDFLKFQKIIANSGEISKIGVRIVAPGKHFQENKIIDKNYLKNLGRAEKQAPLHIKPTLEEVKKIKKIFKNKKIFGISDSAFHKDMPEKSKFTLYRAKSR